MSETTQSLDILMYHSISNEVGPTQIAPDLFRQQMQVIKGCSCVVVSLNDVIAWHAGRTELPARAVVLTFDDAFENFYTEAFPVLSSFDWPATVFVPTDRVGGHGNWDDPEVTRDCDRLMTWEQISELSKKNIQFGSHSVSHSDLSKQRDAEVRKELEVSKETLSSQIDSGVQTFAPPFGHTNPGVLRKIADYYDLSVGTRLARATRHDNIFDLPRIEIHYFRDLDRLRAHLRGSGEVYFKVRQGLRLAGQMAAKLTGS